VQHRLQGHLAGLAARERDAALRAAVGGWLRVALRTVPAAEAGWPAERLRLRAAVVLATAAATALERLLRAAAGADDFKELSQLLLESPFDLVVAQPAAGRAMQAAGAAVVRAMAAQAVRLLAAAEVAESARLPAAAEHQTTEARRRQAEARRSARAATVGALAEAERRAADADFEGATADYEVCAASMPRLQDASEPPSTASDNGS
jgi:hypothetical protein